MRNATTGLTLAAFLAGTYPAMAPADDQQQGCGDGNLLMLISGLVKVIVGRQGIANYFKQPDTKDQVLCIRRRQ